MTLKRRTFISAVAIPPSAWWSVATPAAPDDSGAHATSADQFNTSTWLVVWGTDTAPKLVHVESW